MPAFLKTVLVQDVTPAADGLYTYDLPVNPLSHILMTVKALNNTGTLTNYSPVLELLSAITKLEVLYKGSAIVSASLVDLARLVCILLRKNLMQLEQVNTDDAIRAITVPILFGRKPFLRNECFPASRKGELQLQLTADIAMTGTDGIIFQIETVELLEATPKQFLKYTGKTATPAATGEMDVDLPIGNDLLGILLYSTTVPTGTAWTTTIDYLKLMLDNVEYMYAKSNWETLHNELCFRVDECVQNAGHKHLENTATAYTQNADTDEQEVHQPFFDNYAYLDFDPLENDEYLLPTEGRASVKLRVNAGDTNAMRIMPVEIIRLGAPA